MATWFELSLRSKEQVWRSLRGRRAKPPATGDAERAATFRSALEQAEQQFRAAALVDFDSRALNLFYGLSQAGRALAAAAAGLPDDGWRLKGHGLTVPNLEDASAEIRTLRIATSGTASTSFRRLSNILGSAQPRSTTIGQLWPSLYETNIFAPLDKSLYQPLIVNCDNQRLPSGNFVAQSATIELPADLLAIPVADRPKLAEYLSRYPACAGWIEQTPSGSSADWPGPNMALSLRWALPNMQVHGHVLDGRLILYRGELAAFPTLEGETQTIHPLMAWWMVLYALSMLTRYHPDLWTKMIDVNSSEDATAIEFVLETALSAVPDLLDETINAVAE